MCHYCGHSEPLPPICPECGGEFSFIGAGTQRVQEELEKLFPGIEILRMDADTINASCSHEAILTRFERNKVPILLGTQMVTKGLNFDNVTLVGVIAADLSLYLDDYRSGERTFSLLTQVVGRAGRGEKTGRAVIQTFTPKNEVILAAARQDYDGFYRSEVELRRQLGCPPFLDFFVLTVTGMEENEVYRAGLRLRAQLEQSLSAFQGFQYRLLGPAPAPVVKVNNYFRYRLTLGCRNTKQMRSLISGILVEFAKDRKNRTVSAYADLNPEG
jgi:primosomal protein N' (replication factor Y)